MNIINDNSTNIVSVNINDIIYIITTTDGGVTILNETDNVAYDSADSSHFSKVTTMQDFIYLLKESDNAVYKSINKIQNISSDGFELETVLLPNTVSGENAIEFDGSDDYLKVLNNINIQNTINDYSYSVSLNSGKMDNVYSTFIYKGSGNVPIYISFVNTGYIYAQFKDGVSNLVFTSDVGTIKQNTDYILTFVKVSDNFKVYLWNELIGKIAIPSINSMAEQGDLFLGMHPSATELLTGTIHKVRLYNYALPPEKIRDYSNGVELYDEDKWGKNLSSGTVENGTVYKIVTFVAGDDFTNIGGTNISGSTFISTGTTPTVWTNSSLLIKQGCTAEWKADNYNVTTLADGTAITGQSSIATAAIVSGNVYTILTTGDTNFVALGATDNNPGTTFTASADGIGGTGTVTNVAYLYDSEFIEGSGADISSSSLIATQSTTSNQPTKIQLPTKHSLVDIERLRYGLKYNGIDQYSSAANDPNLNFGTGDFSIEIFAKLADYASFTSCSLFRNWAAPTGVYLGLFGGVGATAPPKGKFRIGIGNTTTPEVSYYTSQMTDIFGIDVHIVFSCTRAGNARLYINNIQRETSSIAAANGVDITNTSIKSIFSGGMQSNEGFSGKGYFARLHNHALSQEDVTARWYNGDPMGFVEPYETREANQTALTSGTLVIGKQYIIDTFVVGDDFTNAGGTNVSGNVFVATATTPTTWTNLSSLKLQGNVADWDFTKFPSSVETEDGSGNGNTLTHINSPTVISTEPLPTSIAANDDKVVVGFKSSMDVIPYSQGGIVILENE